MKGIVAVLALLVCAPLQAAWLKGNLRTHTLESDGDSTPAEVVRWYAEHGSGERVLQESAGLSATYTIRGDEGYVRAKVVDSNGRAAWMQPLFVRP